MREAERASVLGRCLPVRARGRGVLSGHRGVLEHRLHVSSGLGVVCEAGRIQRHVPCERTKNVAVQRHAPRWRKRLLDG